MGSKSVSKTAAPLIPLRPTISKLREAAVKCTACPLYADATQTVFGEGPVPAKLMLVGETPGDQEDKQGRPFVGPAGKLLDRCLAEVGIARDEAYVTNAVKHFKWEPRGKRRLHKKPNALEIAACRPWLEAEIALVKPEVLVLLGATAAQTLLGSTFRVSRERGKPIRSDLAPCVIATVHPSALLRAPDDETRHREIARFVVELRRIAAILKKAS
jgi:uracil-DNA glycosylase